MTDQRDDPVTEVGGGPLLPPVSTAETGAGSSTRSRLAIGAIVGLALLAVCGVLVLSLAPLLKSADRAAEPASVPKDEEWVPVYLERAWVADDGNTVLVSTYDKSLTPMAVAVDLESGQARELRGYMIAAVEPGPVAWLLPMSASEYVARSSKDGLVFGLGVFDEPPASLEVWEADVQGSLPDDAAPSRWRTVHGPGEWDAYLEVDVLRGAHPSRLLFNDRASSGEGHKAQLPEDFATFSFLGFSPTGAYVALEELIQVSDMDEGWSESTWSLYPFEPDGWLPSRRVVIVRAADGTITAQTELGDDVDQGRVFWAPDGDRLVWIAHTSSGATTDSRSAELRGLDADGRVVDMLEVWGVEPPSGWDAESWHWLAGVDTGRNAVLALSAETDSYIVWEVGPAGFAQVGSLPFESLPAFYYGDVGFVQVEARADDEGAPHVNVVRYDASGTTSTVLWTGPAMPGGDSW